MTEIWKTSVRFPKYDISSMGKIRHKVNRIIRKTFKSRCGASIHLKHENGKETYVLMHHEVMYAFVGDRPNGMLIDHLDGDTTNNNLSNLKYVTPRENNHNRKDQSKYGIGVYRKGKTFFSQIRINGKDNYLGSFKTPELAGEAYQNKAQELANG